MHDTKLRQLVAFRANREHLDYLVSHLELDQSKVIHLALKELYEKHYAVEQEKKLLLEDVEPDPDYEIPDSSHLPSLDQDEKPL